MSRLIFLCLLMLASAAFSAGAPLHDIESCGPIDLFLGDRLESKRPAYAHLYSSNQNDEKQVKWTLQTPNVGLSGNPEDWTDKVTVKTLKETKLDSGSYTSMTGTGTYRVEYVFTSRKVVVTAEENIGFPEFLKSDVSGLTNKLTKFVLCKRLKWYPKSN